MGSCRACLLPLPLSSALHPLSPAALLRRTHRFQVCSSATLEATCLVAFPTTELQGHCRPLLLLCFHSRYLFCQGWGLNMGLYADCTNSVPLSCICNWKDLGYTRTELLNKTQLRSSSGPPRPQRVGEGRAVFCGPAQVAAEIWAYLLFPSIWIHLLFQFLCFGFLERDPGGVKEQAEVRESSLHYRQRPAERDGGEKGPSSLCCTPERGSCPPPPGSGQSDQKGLKVPFVAQQLCVNCLEMTWS